MNEKYHYLSRILRKNIMLGGVRVFYKEVDSFSKVLISRPGVRHCRVNNESEKSVVIPPRIKRGPTDVLKALASTVEVDHTGFHYKYPDDPYFYSYSENKRKILGLSIESGRKSARWVFKNNPGFFINQLSEPPIQEFFVKPEVKAESEPTEETLLRAIEERNVLRAIEVYKVLESKNCDISEPTKQCLLELTCFYNGEERPNDNAEEKWFLMEAHEEKKNINWMNKGFAEKLYEKMDSSCSLANSAIIQGMLKYNEVPLACEIFEAAKMKKVKLSIGVYNMFLSKAKEIGKGDAVEVIVKMLNEMSEEKIRPNVGTLNAILHSIYLTAAERSWETSSDLSDFALKVFGEFERLGIEPSLGSYGYLFKILSFNITNRKKSRTICYDLMTLIERKKFEILHSSDLIFFSSVSAVFSLVFHDPDLTLRLLDMCFRDDNSKFVVSFKDETIFLSNVFYIILEKKPIEFVMGFYRRYFYTTLSVSLKNVLALISVAARENAPQYVLEVWEDIKGTPLRKNEILLNKILSLMSIFSDESSLKLFHSVALFYLFCIKQDADMRNNSKLLSNVLIAFVKNGDEENILNLFEILKNTSRISLKQDAVEALYYYGLSEKKIPLLVESLEIAASEKLPTVNEMARRALPFLTGDSRTWATELIKE